MAYRYGDRRQKTFFPESIDEYIPQEAPVRAYDAIIDSIDLAELGIDLDPHKVGCPLGSCFAFGYGEAVQAYYGLSAVMDA